ncbi:MAG: hypothetical protein HC895_03705 [Leptolyngbyaceae cyanobacterium SM1_3_5]|nr:hypothetical protein [Leptolyngbyaceae cyanobacterium SM1_3_5]
MRVDFLINGTIQNTLQGFLLHYQFLKARVCQCEDSPLFDRVVDESGGCLEFVRSDAIDD